MELGGALQHHGRAARAAVGLGWQRLDPGWPDRDRRGYTHGVLQPHVAERLTAWAVAGVDVHAQLPQLSAYLGRVNVLGTEVYLKARPQLMELASRRFEQHSLGRQREP